MPYTYEEFLSAKMPEIEENAFYRWWSNYKNIRKEEPEIVAKDAFDAGVSALMILKQTLENDNQVLEKRVFELEAQIEKMKCGQNCKHSYLYQEDRKCKFTYCDCINCKDKWELRR